MTANQSNAQRNSRATKAMFVALALVATLFTAVSPASAVFGGGDGGFLHSYSTFTGSDGLSDATIVFSQDQTLGPVDSFSVFVTPVQGGSQELPNFVAGTGDATSVYTLDLEPRLPGIYRMEIMSQRGGSSGSNVYDLILPSAPQIVEAKAGFGEPSIAILWDAPQYGEVSSYDVVVTDLLNTFSVTVPGDRTSTVVDGLELPTAEHFITVRARFEGNQSIELAPTVAKTSVVAGDGFPNPPSNVTFELLTPTSARVNWVEDTTSKPFTTPTTSVTVTLTAGPHFVEKTVDAGIGTATITGLDLDTFYSIGLSMTNKGSSSVLLVGNLQTGSSAIADTIKPEIVLGAPATVSRYGATGKVSFTCTDNVAVVSCGGSHTNGQAISTKTVGKQTVSIQATDAAGNEQTASTTVTVSWAFTGQFAGISGNKATVARFYAATFGRLPDQGGYDYWTGRLDTEPNGLAAAAQFFATSDEFEALYGANVTDTQFVDTIYLNVLGRAPEGAGRTFWIDSLGNGTQTRGSVMAFFANSPEHKTITATS